MARNRKGKKAYRKCIATHTRGKCHKGMKGGKKKCMRRVGRKARKTCARRR